jgi:hypothetical protein
MTVEVLQVTIGVVFLTVWAIVGEIVIRDN